MVVPDPDAMVKGALDLIRLGKPVDRLPLMTHFGVPVEDLLMTPFSAVIATLSHAAGRVFFHHEKRGYIPMPDGLLPPSSLSELPRGVPVW